MRSSDILLLHIMQCIHPEAFRKELPLSLLFSSYFDIRKEFAKGFGGAEPTNMQEIYARMFQGFDAGSRNGINECRSIAMVSSWLVQHGGL